MVRPFAVLALCIIGFLLIRSAMGSGLYRECVSESHLRDGDMARVAGYLKKIEYSKDKYQLFLEDSILSLDNEEYQSGTIILSVQKDTDTPVTYEIGGLIYGMGRWDALSQATNPGQFDEYGYYKSIGVDGRLAGSVESVDASRASHFKTWLASLRLTMSETIDGSVLEEEDRAVLKAMVLGDKSELTPELKDLYKNAGIIHLISISGLHITIIGMGLYKLLRKGGRSFIQAGFTAGVVMLGFVIMTGASVSSVRALISFIVLLGGEVFGRTSDPINTLSISASILLISNGGLLYNSGFWLSFSSVLGISLLGLFRGQDHGKKGSSVHSVHLSGYGCLHFRLYWRSIMNFPYTRSL